MLLLALFLPAGFGAEFLQTDAAAPGMAVNVHILRESGGAASATVTTSCDDIVVGPAVVLDRGGNPATPVTGGVVSTVFFVHEDASPASCTVYVDGVALEPLNDGIDNLFDIVDPLSAPLDGGYLDADLAADGFITLGHAARSDGGTLVLESLSVGVGESLVFDTDDPLSDTAGNESFLPVILLVEGEAVVAGTIDLSGLSGGYAGPTASDGGDGGPGGGGGGVGGNCLFGLTGVAGDGFTGGGGMIAESHTGYRDGGFGAVTGPSGSHGGEGLFTTTLNSAVGYAGGSGGGSGVAWGTGGGGGEASVTSGEGGYGGGGGSGHADATDWGGGGGGFGTDGENGKGVVGGARIVDGTGGAGLSCGHPSLVPLGGGSGGSGGESGSGNGDGAGGGGGGGALYLQAGTITFLDGVILAAGGDGGSTVGTVPGSSSGGGGGSGGAIHLCSPDIRWLTGDSTVLDGGWGGSTYAGWVGGTLYYPYFSGSGGQGRLRVDGVVPPALDVGPTGETPTSWQGPAIVEVDGAGVTVEVYGSSTLTVLDDVGTLVGSAAVAGDGWVDLSSLLVAGRNHLILADSTSGLMSAAGTAVIDYVPDEDGDGYPDAERGGTDCDDDDPSVHPGALEVCNGVDDDCDDVTDGADALDAVVWYLDDDGDGFGDPETSVESCEAPADHVSDGSDCDDGEESTYPGADEECDDEDDDCDGEVDEDSAVDAGTWYVDHDGDGYGEARYPMRSCEQPTGYVANDDDCDDLDATAAPDQDEVCDGVDNDCDDEVDDDDDDLDTATATTWYLDGDDDGHGDPGSTALTCVAPSDHVAVGDDCDDEDGAVHPGAVEVCNGADDDCDGDTDGADALDPVVWYLDDDGDGFGDAGSTVEACDAPDDHVADGSDCDDGRRAVNPGADEKCNDRDDDCDGEVDEDDAIDADTWYVDHDGDGHGEARYPTRSCEQPSGYVAADDDCDDLSAAVAPGLDEVCDGVDNDCDGDVDDADGDLDTATATTWYLDDDEDGYGDPATTALACTVPEDHVAGGGDCDDEHGTVHPGADEVCDLVDNDCDGATDEDDAVDASTWYADLDGDGYGGGAFETRACAAPAGFVSTADDCDDFDASTYPGAPETCDDEDDDCDDEVDEGLELLTWYGDGDGDGFGDLGTTAEDCGQPDGHVADGTDCDDEDEDVHPGADEVWYDGVDQDCDSADDYDYDGDGHAHSDHGGTDCDDEDEDIHPDADEVWYDGVDQDCDQASDWDRDGDGHDHDAFGGDDCDDFDSTVYPGADETWYDGVDQDCDGNDDDQDGDGYSSAHDCDDTDPEVFPGATGWTHECEPLADEVFRGGGCGCQTSPRSGPWGVALLGLLGVAATRRRRARAG